jgi:hypothetical protein
MIKKFLGYLFLFLHILPLIIIILLAILIMLNFKIKKIISYIIVIYSTIIIIGWIIFGNCVLTPLENYLLSSSLKYKDNTSRSYITVIIEKYSNLNDTQIYYFFVYLQIFIMIFFLSHIIYSK